MLRKAKIEDAQAIQNLICFYSEDGKMLFRSLEEIEQAIADFRVYEKSGEVIGICNLKYGWEKLVEIRSLGVDPRYHRRGIATQMIKDSINQALLNQNCETVFVLTYAIPLFEKLGFQIIDKINLPQKVWNDCQQCLHQDNCDETAMSFSLIRDENLPFTDSKDTPEKVVSLPKQIKPSLGNPEQVFYSA
ncbi:N-acetyltransferase [Nitrospinaceae bacterium]|nr:N-acetyltransferase [Nitrospinaceae bacterium]